MSSPIRSPKFLGSQPPSPTKSTTSVSTPPAVTGKVDKAAAKAAKAARRAVESAAKGGGATEGGKPIPVVGGTGGPGGSSTRPIASTSTSTSSTTINKNNSNKILAVENLVQKQSDPLQLFLHLETPSNSSNLSHNSNSSNANIRPSIIRLALQYSEFKIVGANARCIAMLEAFKDVISAYFPPNQTNLTRHLPTHLGAQISHLIRARPLSVSMGNAIRYLKYEISLIEMEMNVEEAKQLLIKKIDSFKRDRILLADKVIEQHAIAKIKDGETILTYARSSVVEGVLLEAKRQGKEFNVVVVDSRPLYEGKILLSVLLAANIPTTYVLLPALSLILPRVSLCLLGTHSLLSNGSMFSRAGTAMVAMLLKEKGVPVICCCETYKFSERIMLDSIVGNEMASPLPLLSDFTSPVPNTLSPLSLLYDVSRPEDVTVVITEAGLIPVQSVPVLLRDFKPLMQGS